MITNPTNHNGNGSGNGNGNGNGHVPAPPVSDIHVNTYLLHTIYHRRKRVWAVLGTVIFAGLLVRSLTSVPQIYAAKVSISMQQPVSSATGGGLAALAGLGGGGQKYIGILQSRLFAEQVAQQVGLEGLNTDARPEVLENLSKSLKIDDAGADGLMYLNVEMAGPAKFAPNADAKRSLVKRQVAQIANTYADVFRNYLKDSDTDRESVLMREAEKQFSAIDNATKQEVEKLRAFMTGKQGRRAMLAVASTYSDAATALLSNTDSAFGTPGGGSAGDSGASPNASSGSIGAISGTPTRNSEGVSAAGSQLATMLMRKSDMEGKLAAARKADEMTRRILSDPNAVETMPDEDPLLTEARKQFNKRQTELKELRISYGEEQPAVVAAKERLAQAKTYMQNRIDSYLRGNTTQKARLEELEAEYKEVNRQIALAEKNAKANRDSGFDLEQLKVDVVMHQTARGALFTKLVEMRSQMVAGQNRMRVIDRAIAPRWAKTGVMQSAIISVLGALFFVLAWLGIEYFITNTRQYTVTHTSA